MNNSPAPAITVVDNYDSFVYNLVQYLGQLGAKVTVVRNDAVEVPELLAGAPDGVLLSPGPGTPQTAGICIPLILAAGQLPVFGVCLGLQAITVAFGGRVGPAATLMHGKTSEITHDGKGVFAGLPSPLTVARYHSLAADPESIPPELVVSATAPGGEIMGVRHRSLPIEAVQFHPESVLTEYGHDMIANWLRSLNE